jgi:hypothetical protein
MRVHALLKKFRYTPVDFFLYCQYPSEQQELIQVLRRSTMPDRTVILTMVDESHAKPGSMLEVLLQSFKTGQGTQRLLNHLVIITMDPQAFEYCRFLHPHCIHPSTFQHYFATKRQSLSIPDHNVFSWRRNNVLIEVIELGYNIIFTVWLLLERNFFHPKVISNPEKNTILMLFRSILPDKSTFFSSGF